MNPADWQSLWSCYDLRPLRRAWLGEMSRLADGVLRDRTFLEWLSFSQRALTAFPVPRRPHRRDP